MSDTNDCFENLNELELVDRLESELNEARTDLGTKVEKVNELTLENAQFKKDLNELKMSSSVMMFLAKHDMEQSKINKIKLHELVMESDQLKEKLKETEMSSTALESKLNEVMTELNSTKEKLDDLSHENTLLTEQAKERDLVDSSKGQVEETGVELAHSSDVDVVGPEEAVSAVVVDENAEYKTDGNIYEGTPTIPVLNAILRDQDALIAEMVIENRNMLEAIGQLKVRLALSLKKEK